MCKLYGVQQSLTCPYNLHGNAQCERFNHTMFSLLRTLSKGKKAEWPVHLPSLVFAYNATPHSTTGFLPYQLMFGCKAPAPCDNWLGLREYEDNCSVSKTEWVNNQFERVMAANKRAMRNIKAAVAKNRKSAGGSDIDIPAGNLVLLRNYPEGRHKIQDHNKPDLFLVVGSGERPNNYWIKPLGTGGTPRQVNQRELFNLGVTENGLRQNDDRDEEEEEEDQEPAIPVLDPVVYQSPKSEPKSHYNL